MTELPDIVTRALALPGAIASDLSLFGGVLRCGTCHGERPLGDVGSHLGHGWPKCCGLTMTRVTQRQLGAEGPARRPERVQLRRVRGWRLPPGAVSVARPTKWGNPFAVGTDRALARIPAAIDEGADWEYEGRISAAGTRHDYFHADGRVTVCNVRYMTAAEAVETYRRALTGDYSPAMRMSSGRFIRVTVEDARRELAGKSLACWCPLPAAGEPDACHARVLLEVANA